MCAARCARLPECRHVPILMQTSLDDMDSVNRAYNAGATDFSSKGINPMLLAQRVKFLVRAKQTQDQLRESEARVRYLAYYDPLTGLPNRQRLLQLLEQHVEWAMPRQRGIAVLMLDIDNFSRINDTQGPAVGDVLLKEVANRLQHCLAGLRASALQSRTAARKPGTSRIGWRAPAATNSHWRCPACPRPIAHRSWHGACSSPWRGRSSLPQQEVPLSATIGISIYPLDAAGAEALINNADAAMHHAQEGRARRHGILQEIDQHARRQTAVARGGLAQGAGAAASSRSTINRASPLEDLRSRPSRRCCAGRIRSAASSRRTNSSRWRSRAA